MTVSRPPFGSPPVGRISERLAARLGSRHGTRGPTPPSPGLRLLQQQSRHRPLDQADARPQADAVRLEAAREDLLVIADAAHGLALQVEALQVGRLARLSPHRRAALSPEAEALKLTLAAAAQQALALRAQCGPGRGAAEGQASVIDTS